MLCYETQIVIGHFPAPNEAKLHVLGLECMYGAGARGREVPSIPHMPMPSRFHPGEAGRGNRANQTVEDVIHGGLCVTSSGQVGAYCSNKKHSREMSL